MLALALDSNLFDSPFVVPVAGCCMVLGIVVVGAWQSARTREIQAQERLAAIARGVPPPPTMAELELMHGKPVSSVVRRRANIRLTGIILLSIGGGLIAFFSVLTAILQVRAVLSGAAVGLIPVVMGIGFLVDARLQTKEVEDAAEASPYTPPSALL
jgi:anti-sigma factor RsiW